jgi:DNA replicative helicase MCM subunit Mcm2 (Cdc46/Mcm family)
LNDNKAVDDFVTGGQVITATARQIESLIRLSEALARMRFSEVVMIIF